MIRDPKHIYVVTKKIRGSLYIYIYNEMDTNWIRLLFEVKNTFLKNFLVCILKDINKAKLKTLCFY